MSPKPQARAFQRLRRKLRQNRAQQHRTDARESNSKMEQGLQQTIAKSRGRTVIWVRHPEGGFIECHRAALALSTVRAAPPNHDPRAPQEIRSPDGSPRPLPVV